MPKETTTVKLNECIKRLAKKKYRSNLSFATACDIDEGTVRRIFSGKYNLSVRLLEKISDALEVRISDLFKEIGK